MAAKPDTEEILRMLKGRSLVFVGMMGSGKSAIGRITAQALGMNHVDSDAEVERAANMSVSEIFESLGEDKFRDGEEKVIRRLIEERQRVISLGGGAFLSPSTREFVRKRAISIWMKGSLDVLMERIKRRPEKRPLMRTENPRATLEALMREREPIYELADIHMDSSPHSRTRTLAATLNALGDWLRREAQESERESRQARKPQPGKPKRKGEIRTVRVELGERSYPVFIGSGILEGVGERIAQARQGARCAVVADEIFQSEHKEHGARLRHSLEAGGVDYREFHLPGGEASKSFESLQRVLDFLLGGGFERRDFVLAMGGGCIGDLAGFAAAIARRGMDCIQIPTTLLAQVDSSVGGKTGINAKQGKNLIGAFHQPAFVLADASLLKTLDERNVRAGYAEIVKYALIGQADFFDWLEWNLEGILALGDPLEEAIARSCAAKARIVALDERESDSRALLNLGHTFAHALEGFAAYDETRLVHGEAVAVGLNLAFLFSRHLGLCPARDADRVRDHLRRAGLPCAIHDIPGPAPAIRELMGFIEQDKKKTRGELTFILAEGIGEAVIKRDVHPVEQLAAFLKKELRLS